MLLVDLDEEAAREIIKAFMLESSLADDAINAVFTNYLLDDSDDNLRVKIA